MTKIKRIKRSELSKSISNSIINDYQSSELTVKEIQEKYNISSRTLNHLKDEYNVTLRTQPISESTYKLATEEFLSGGLLMDVCEKHSMSYVSLYNYMRRNNIDYYNDKGRKNHFNKSYFKTIDTEDKAYFFGFLYADGSIVRSNKYDKFPNRLSLNISSRDRVIIEKFLIAINGDGIKITDYTPTGTFSENKMSRITLNSIDLTKDMVENGYRMLKKEASNEVFKHVPNQLLRHFIRGYYDGDGSSSYLHIRFSGGDSFLNSLNKILTKKGMKNHRLYTYSDQRKNKSFTLSYNGRENITTLYNYLYDNANYYLPRKKEAIESLLSK